jgi:hypothetical protein
VVAGCFERVSRERSVSPNVLPEPDGRTTETTGMDWVGFPCRVGACLSRAEACRLLDWRRSPRGDEGRRRLQEEYLEWRVVRRPDGRIARVEMTTELPEYWRVLAAHEPGQALALAADFAREPTVPPAGLYGSCDPFAAGVSPADRERAFVTRVLARGSTSPYNDGRKAICCMVQPTNTLSGLVALGAGAVSTHLVRDPSSGRVRPMTANEVIPRLGPVAQEGRSSDPVVVERLGRLALEGRLVAFDDPVGIYIQGVERTRLRQPDGSEVPAEWFTFGRGVGPPVSEDGRSRYQRLVFEVPEGEELCVGDLVDVATERPIHYGAQVAELVQLALFVRVSGSGVAPMEAVPAEPGATGPARTTRCADVLRHDRQFRLAEGG